MADDTGSRETHGKAASKAGSFISKHKWELIAGLAAIAVLVFYFVNKSNASASASNASGEASSGIDPNTGIPYSEETGGGSDTGGYYGGDYGGGGGGFAGPAGATGATGPAGKPGSSGGNIFSISAAQARALLAGGQRPFVFSGGKYVPATSVTAGQAYYAGPLEENELQKKTGPFKPASVSVKNLQMHPAAKTAAASPKKKKAA